MTKRVVSSVDLFSGIGGISLALAGFCTPVVYCDINKYCQQVLTERMQEGRLDKAPIHSDVSTLHLSSHTQPDMVCAGFPCTDVSSIGLQKGIHEDTSSGLFLQVMRLVDENPSIKVVFLENVSNITRCGLKDVVRELTARHFTFAWTMKSAASVGAPHQRNRWFCLAVRNGFCTRTFDVHNTDILFPVSWDNEPSARVSFRPTFKQDDSFDEHWIMRYQTLGNTVCPSAVRSAFVDLVKLHNNAESIRDCFSSHAQHVDTLDYPFPDCGMILDDSFFPLPKFERETEKTGDRVVATMHHKGNTHVLSRLPTPRRGNTHPANVTDRTVRDLPTILLYCRESREYIQRVCGDEQLPDKLHSIATPNVRYVEYMMGYPQDWTKVRAQWQSKVRRDEDSSDTYVRSEASETHLAAETVTPDVAGSPQRHVRKLNGMHMLMREWPGCDVKDVAKKWRVLDKHERDAYTARARAANLI